MFPTLLNSTGLCSILILFFMCKRLSFRSTRLNLEIAIGFNIDITWNKKENKRQKCENMSTHWNVTVYHCNWNWILFVLFCFVDLVRKSLATPVGRNSFSKVEKNDRLQDLSSARKKKESAAVILAYSILLSASFVSASRLSPYFTIHSTDFLWFTFCRRSSMWKTYA